MSMISSGCFSRFDSFCNFTFSFIVAGLAYLENEQFIATQFDILFFPLVLLVILNLYRLADSRTTALVARITGILIWWEPLFEYLVAFLA